MHVLRKLFWVSIVALALFSGVLIGMDNSAPVALRFLRWESPQISIFLWMILAFALGVGTAVLFGGVDRLTRAARTRLGGGQRTAGRGAHNSSSAPANETTGPRAHEQK